MRRALLLVVPLLALSVPEALGQAPVDPFDDPPEGAANPVPGPVQPGPGRDAPGPDEPGPEATATPEGCDEPGPGTDGDEAYCPGVCLDDEETTDADYVYCAQANAGTGRPPGRKRRRAPAVRPLAAHQLPLTGGEPWLIAACGAGSLMAGAGLRLRSRPR